MKHASAPPTFFFSRTQTPVRLAWSACVAAMCWLAASARADFVIDGVNNFAAGATFATSDAGYTGYLAGNSTSLHFGYNGLDIQTGGANHFVVAYLGANGSSTTSGINFNTQQPNLPFAATHALVYRADGGFTQLYGYSGASWNPIVSSTSVAEGGTFFEAGLSLGDLGSPAVSVDFVSYLLFQGSGFESSYAAMPSSAFANGTYDPNPSTFLTVLVPEPSTAALLLAGLLAGLRRRAR